MPLGRHGVRRHPAQLPAGLFPDTLRPCDGPLTRISPTAPIRVEKDGVRNPLNA